jgi:hypothetical protein
MRKWSPGRLRRKATSAYNRVGGSDVVKRREIATSFAKRHNLVYFHTVGSEDEATPIIRGVTAGPRQTDSNFCIGTHAGYDMALIERAADIEFIGFQSTSHTWYVLEIDLKNAHRIPFVFVGTKQLPKAFYAKVLISRRDIRYLQLDTVNSHAASFHGTYALISSPNNLTLLHEVFDDETINMMAAHKYPFSIEIEGDSLILFTEAIKPNEQLIDKLLHYGLWFAKKLDETLD